MSTVVEVSTGEPGTATSWRQVTLWEHDDHAVVEFSDDLIHDDYRFAAVVDGWGHKLVHQVMLDWLHGGYLPEEAEQLPVAQVRAVTSLPMWEMRHRWRLVETVADPEPF